MIDDVNPKNYHYVIYFCIRIEYLANLDEMCYNMFNTGTTATPCVLQVNVSAANRLLRKAVDETLEVSAYYLIEFLCINDKTLATDTLYDSVRRLTSEDIKDLHGIADDDVIIDICLKRNLLLPERSVS